MWGEEIFDMFECAPVVQWFLYHFPARIGENPRSRNDRFYPHLSLPFQRPDCGVAAGFEVGGGSQVVGALPIETKEHEHLKMFSAPESFGKSKVSRAIDWATHHSDKIWTRYTNYSKFPGIEWIINELPMKCLHKPEHELKWWAESSE